MCALPVGLPDMCVIGVGHWPRWLPDRDTTEVVDGHEKLLGLLAAGDPRKEVWFAWNAKGRFGSVGGMTW
jgi:hypothetical protein